MGQILIIQDRGEIGASLSADHSVVHAASVADVRNAIGEQAFHAAVAVVKDAADAHAFLTIIQEADADLTAVLITPGTGDAGGPFAEEERAWEIVARSSPHALRSAVRRAIRHTGLLRENRMLRNQHVDAPSNGNGANGMPLQWITSLPPRFDLRELLSSVEKGVIQRTLEATRGAQAEAARRLGLSRSDLSYKLAKYELRKPAAVRSN